MKRVEKSHLTTAAQSHPGMSGKNNEDRFGVSAYQIGEKTPIPVLLAVLSDGIGGHRAGEVAAEIAVNLISERVAQSDGRHPAMLLQQAIIDASAEIYEEAQSKPEQQGMGATCVAALVRGDQLFAATVGDSRLYLLRAGQIRKLSTDHTWIQEALDAGLLSPSDVEGHPNAHVIRRYLGSPNQPQVDLRLRFSNNETSAQSEGNQGAHLLPDDILLLCSDGLSDLVKDEEILEALESNPLNDAVGKLVDLANERGGHDNITIIALRMPKAQVAAVKTKKVNRIVLGCAGGALLATILAGIVWGALWWSGKKILPPGATPTGNASALPGIPALTPIPGSPVASPSALFSDPAGQPPAPPPLPAPLEGGKTLTPWPTNPFASPPALTIEPAITVTAGDGAEILKTLIVPLKTLPGL
ncbi:MAG: serine/threonine-protein phosphatase [Anaerolineaceae bacterium]|nr:serine/threonine-protein phosphatase [Anaerolineaceae bacterium]